MQNRVNLDTDILVFRGVLTRFLQKDWDFSIKFAHQVLPQT